MKIVVNTRLLLKDKLEGIGWFAYETLKRITTSYPEHQFYFIFDRRYHKDFIFSDNIYPIIAFPPTRHPYLTEFYFNYVVPSIVKKLKPDLFFSPDGWIPTKINVPIVNVIHDLNFEHFPEFLPKASIKHYKKCFPQYAKRSDRIITVSNYTKNDLVKTYNIEPDKIDVAYNGVNPIYTPIDEVEKRIIKAQYSEGKDYFIFVSSIHPRKNLENTLKAFFEFKKETASDIKFIIVGTFMFKSKELLQIYNSSPYNKDVIFLGYVKIDLLHKLLASALALTYISFFEGFGIPIVEAMSCGTAVITSNTTSMPEVAGDSAILVSPKDVKRIKEAMKKIWIDKEYRGKLVEKGLLRSKDFSWDKTAKILWNSINNLTNNIL